MRIGLSLGGGGARGICHMEYLKVLDELNIKPHIISGTSIGAVFGALYAAGLSGKDIDEIVREFNLLDFTGLLDFAIFKETSVLKGKAVAEYLHKIIPAQTFEELQIPLKVVATDFWKREQVIMDTGDLIGAIRASISIPAIFEPVCFQDRVLIDGGAVNPLPYDIIRKDCDFLIAIDITGIRIPEKKHPVPNMFQSVLSTFEITQEALIQCKWEQNKPDLIVRPPLRNVEVLDFHKIKSILKSVQDDVKTFKQDLVQALEKQKGNLIFWRLFNKDK